ncbi:MAG: hypothetical protein JSU83_00485 [Deltaproteobacteria bacterium]|nr:MAG: hypothetical protein JSU83_00485 [Deltaproteobacteria bacterium]
MTKKTMTWDEHYQLWSEARKRPGPDAHLRMQEARKRVGKNNPDDWLWLKESLSDSERKRFVGEVFKFQPVAKRLFASMLYAGVMERDPSRNRAFIDPCVRSFGARRVLEELLRFLCSGTDIEKAGAASAFLWAWGGGNPRNEEVDDLIRRFRFQMLREFVTNDDLQVRRRIIPLMSLKPEDYPEEFRLLVAIATKIACSHPDEFIRHCFEVQFGAGGPFMPIPDTRSGNTDQGVSTDEDNSCR